MAFTFSCTACGQCCKHGGPALSIEEAFKYQNILITGLRWSGCFVSSRPLTRGYDGALVSSPVMREHLTAIADEFTFANDSLFPFVHPMVTGFSYDTETGCSALNADGTCGIHSDKPDMCRSVPFDPILPEHYQQAVLRSFAKHHDCMRET